MAVKADDHVEQEAGRSASGKGNEEEADNNNNSNNDERQEQSGDDAKDGDSNDE